MTRLLVSVRDAEEAIAALKGGADLIDVKEPLRGSLGPASQATIQSVIDAVGGRVPVSAALGELPDLTRGLDLRKLPTGLRFVKIGLANCGGTEQWSSRWKQVLSTVPSGIERVAVAYADCQEACAPRPMEVLECARSAGCTAVLIDTFSKTRGDLFSACTHTELVEFINRARSEPLMLVVAGSLTTQTIGRAVNMQPDYFAVRGAACAESRVGKICSRKVCELKRILQRAQSRAIAASSIASD